MLDLRRALVSQVVGRALVQHVAGVLAAADIPVLPLKGVWLQACVCAPDEPRVITDVDLLVQEGAFDAARRTLERAGFQAASSNPSAVSLVHPAFELPLDLHRRLFTRRAFRLPTDALFARSHADSSAFGVQVQLPDPLDALAHLVGHFIKSRTPPGDTRRLSDFVVIAAHCNLEPAACARHLHAVGMARAARYVLHELAYHRAHEFWRAVIDALPADPTGDHLAVLAMRIGGGRLSRSAAGALPGFMLDRSLPAGAVALLLRSWDRRRDWRIR